MLPELHLDDGSESARHGHTHGMHGPGVGMVPMRARLTVPLGFGESLQVWDDRVVAGTSVYPFDEWFGVRLIVDPRAPLTVDPPLAVALVSHGGHWATYVPPNEQDAVQVVAAIREACQRLEIEPIGIDDAVRLPDLPKQTPPLLFSWEPLVTEEQSFNAVESVLIAIIHLSIFFFPLALPLLVWRVLGGSVPAVAGQAREAAEFQGLFYLVVLPTAGYTVRLALTYGIHPATVLGLLAVGILLLLAAACAFAGAHQAMRGRGFSYRSFAHAPRGFAA